MNSILKTLALGSAFSLSMAVFAEGPAAPAAPAAEAAPAKTEVKAATEAVKTEATATTTKVKKMSKGAAKKACIKEGVDAKNKDAIKTCVEAKLKG